MGFFEASIMFTVGIIAFAVMLSVGVELIPDMQTSMGSTVTLMVSAMFVVILVGGFIIFMRQSQEPDNFFQSGEQNSY